MTERSSNILGKDKGSRIKVKQVAFHPFFSFLLDQDVLEGSTIVGGIINISHGGHLCHEKLFRQNVR